MCANDKPKRTVSMSEWRDGTRNCGDGSDESAPYIVEQIKAGKIENLCGQKKRETTSVDGHFRITSGQEIEESLRSIRKQLEKVGLGGVGRGEDCITTSGGPIQQTNITAALEKITKNQAELAVQQANIAAALEHVTMNPAEQTEMMAQVTRLTRLLAAGSGEEQGCQTNYSYAVAVVTLGWVVLQGLSMVGYVTRAWPGWGNLW